MYKLNKNQSNFSIGRIAEWHSHLVNHKLFSVSQKQLHVLAYGSIPSTGPQKDTC